MARDYPVWFMQGNIQVLLNSGSRMVHDGSGHDLYRYSNGKLTAVSGNGILTVRNDGFILNDAGNQMGFITDYAGFLKDTGNSSGTGKPATASGKGDTNTAPAGARGNTASAGAQKKRRVGWILVLIVIGVIYLINQNKTKEVVYDSFSAAAVPLKQALLAHEDTASVRIRIKNPSKAFAYNEDEELIKAIYKHTGDPNEGDQLALCTVPSIRHSQEDKNSDVYTFTVEYSYYTTKAQEEQLQRAISSTVKGLGLSGKTSYEKVRAIYNWICRHVVYDHARLNDDGYLLKYTAYNAMMEGSAVCSGYAQLFYRMALEAGLEARIVIGGTVGGGSSGHAYNLVRLGSMYYYCDPTWDAGRPESQYEYFLKGHWDFLYHEDQQGAFMNRWYLCSPLRGIENELPISNRTYGLQ